MGPRSHQPCCASTRIGTTFATIPAFRRSPSIKPLSRNRQSHEHKERRRDVKNFRNFLAELQGRNFYRAAVAYGVVSWLLIQIATQLFPGFEIPNWWTRLVIFALILGFPFSLTLAWAY